MAYIYQADVLCDACGDMVRWDLIQAGKAPSNPDDESSYDSDDFPKQYDAENSESDSPENCSAGDCSDNGEYGTFLGNRLTQEGYRYLKSMLDEHAETLPEYAQEWADHYGFSYDGTEWTSDEME